MTYLTIDENFIPKTSHPGKFIKEELDERGRTQVHFAELMGITKAEVNQLIHEKKNVTPMLAYRVAAAFGTSVDVWLGLQNMHDMGKIEKDKKKMEKIKKIKERAYIYYLTSKGTSLAVT